MSEHTTHHDDCGCLSASLREELDATRHAASVLAGEHRKAREVIYQLSLDLADVKKQRTALRSRWEEAKAEVERLRAALQAAERERDEAKADGSQMATRAANAEHAYSQAASHLAIAVEALNAIRDDSGCDSWQAELVTNTLARMEEVK